MPPIPLLPMNNPTTLTLAAGLAMLGIPFIRSAALAEPTLVIIDSTAAASTGNVEARLTANANPPTVDIGVLPGAVPGTYYVGLEQPAGVDAEGGWLTVIVPVPPVEKDTWGNAQGITPVSFAGF